MLGLQYVIAINLSIGHYIKHLGIRHLQTPARLVLVALRRPTGVTIIVVWQIHVDGLEWTCIPHLDR